MLRVLASDGLEKSAVKALQDLGCEVVQQFYEPDDLKQEVKEYDVLVVRSATKVREPIIDAALTTGKLKLIIRGGVGRRQYRRRLCARSWHRSLQYPQRILRFRCGTGYRPYVCAGPLYPFRQRHHA